MNNNYLKNTQVFAHELKNISGENFALLPYNRFEPTTSVWWLAPTSEIPAYKFGKFFIKKEDGKFFFGFSLEKGPNISDKDLYYETLYLQNDWTWNQFMQSLEEQDKSLEKIFHNVTSHTGKYCVDLHFGMMPTGNGDVSDDLNTFLEQKSQFESTKIRAKVNEDLILGDFVLLGNISQPDLMQYLQEKTTNSFNIFDLSEIIQGAPNIDWMWIDLYFGIYISDDDCEESITSLYNNYLNPWIKWVK